jgi:hypothetical protein
VRRTIVATMVVIPFTFTDVGATETDNVLGANDNDRAIQASHGTTAIAGDRVLEVNNIEPPITETSYKGRDRAPLEAAEQQGTDRTHSAFDTGCCDEFLNSLTESSGRTPASTMPNTTITNITDKRIGSSGTQYKCELKPVWLPINLVENAQIRPVYIRNYENGLVRAERLKTLRSRKRTLSQMEAC